MTTFLWTEQHIQTALRMWRKGSSAATIGLEIGASRSAVLGKMNRLGELRSNSVKYKDRVRLGLALPNNTVQGPQRRPVSKTELLQRRLDRTAAAQKRAAEPAPAWTPGQGIHFLGLTPTCCRWPLWPNTKVGAALHYFCGEPTETRPYCGKHAAMSRTSKFEAPSWA